MTEGIPTATVQGLPHAHHPQAPGRHDLQQPLRVHVQSPRLPPTPGLQGELQLPGEPSQDHAYAPRFITFLPHGGGEAGEASFYPGLPLRLQGPSRGRTPGPEEPFQLGCPAPERTASWLALSPPLYLPPPAEARPAWPFRGAAGLCGSSWPKSRALRPRDAQDSDPSARKHSTSQCGPQPCGCPRKQTIPFSG